MAVLFKCDDCPYSTSVKSNLKRHIDFKHTEDRQLFECYYCQQLFASIACCRRHMSIRCEKNPNVRPNGYGYQNDTILGDENVQTYQNDTILYQNDTILHNPNDTASECSQTDESQEGKTQCAKCKKVLSRSQRLQTHTNVCKGVNSPLVCPVCKKVFAFTSSKTRHVVRCRLRAAAKKSDDAKVAAAAKEVAYVKDIAALIKVNRSQSANIINNTVININTDNRVITNNITNNIGILVFPDNTSNEPITFDTDLIDLTDMATTIKTLSKLQVSYKFIVDLLKNPRNRCIRKTNMRSDTSKVHIGGDKWKLQPDSGVYKKLVSEVSLSLGELLGKKEMRRKIGPITLKEHLRYSDLMSDEGYSTNDAEHKALKKEYKLLLQNAKTAVYNASKMDSIKEGNEVPAIDA